MRIGEVYCWHLNSIDAFTGLEYNLVDLLSSSNDAQNIISRA